MHLDYEFHSSVTSFIAMSDARYMLNTEYIFFKINIFVFKFF